MTADTSTFTTWEQVKNNLGLDESTNGMVIDLFLTRKEFNTDFFKI